MTIESRIVDMLRSMTGRTDVITDVITKLSKGTINLAFISLMKDDELRLFLQQYTMPRPLFPEPSRTPEGGPNTAPGHSLQGGLFGGNGNGGSFITTPGMVVSGAVGNGKSFITYTRND